MSDSEIHYNKLTENIQGVESNEKLEENYNNQTKSNEKFLFVFSPDHTAQEFCCGCSLKTGAFIISILQIISSLSSFTTALNLGSNFTLLTSGLVFLAYFSAGWLAYLSSINKDYKNCYTAYIIYAVIFLINLMDSLIISLLIFTGLYHPFYDLNCIRAFLLYMTSNIIVNTIQLYFVWIIYSFAISLKEKNEYVMLKTLCEREEKLI
jgi:hypothetical protein